MKESYIAGQIVAEYNRKEKWKRIARQKCMETTCDLCRFKYICEDREVEDEGNNSIK